MTTFDSSAYQAALDRLLDRINYERISSTAYTQRSFKLERMVELLERLGRPDAALAIVHVAGTKGKGSVSAMVAAGLRAAGYRTGLFSSPHLERLEERFAIDGSSCTAEQLVQLVHRVMAVVAEMDQEALERGRGENGPTYFEVTTAMALCHFAEQRAEAVVLEVGLGGRLDSTNVCHSRVSVITSISFDHEQLLGNTLAAIAAEKAGIIKPGVPVISGVTADEARDVIRGKAAEQGSRLIELQREFRCTYRAPQALERVASPAHVDFEWLGDGPSAPLANLELALLGRHQADNAAVAVATLLELRRQGWRIDEAAIRRGLAEVRWPARLEIVSRRPALLLDAAHNVASIEALLTTLAESFSPGPRVLVFATSRDKNVAGMLQCLLPHFDDVILTRYLGSPRSATTDELDATAQGIAQRLGLARNWRTCPDPASAWNMVTAIATPEHLVTITGSFFLAAEMRRQMEARTVAAGS